MTYPHKSLYPNFTHNRQHVYCGGVIILRTLDTEGNNKFYLSAFYTNHRIPK